MEIEDLGTKGKTGLDAAVAGMIDPSDESDGWGALLVFFLVLMLVGGCIGFVVRGPHTIVRMRYLEVGDSLIRKCTDQGGTFVARKPSIIKITIAPDGVAQGIPDIEVFCDELPLEIKGSI